MFGLRDLFFYHYTYTYLSIFEYFWCSLFASHIFLLPDWYCIDHDALIGDIRGNNGNYHLKLGSWIWLVSPRCWSCAKLKTFPDLGQRIFQSSKRLWTLAQSMEPSKLTNAKWYSTWQVLTYDPYASRLRKTTISFRSTFIDLTICSSCHPVLFDCGEIGAGNHFKSLINSYLKSCNLLYVIKLKLYFWHIFLSTLY